MGFFFFFSSRRRHTRSDRDWSSDVCSSDLLGVLSEHLAPRCAHVHVVEVDRALVPALKDALAPHPNTTLHVADAMALDLDALDPAPTKVVANLPYGIAASAILRTIEELDGVTRWVAMV